MKRIGVGRKPNSIGRVLFIVAVVAGLFGVVLLAQGRGPSATDTPRSAAAEIRTAPVLELEIGMIGFACGGHLGVTPSYVDVSRNSDIRLVNTSMWTHEVYLNTENKYVRLTDGKPPKNAVALGVVEPGESLQVRAPAREGLYYIVTTNQWHHVGGLRGRLVVH